MACLGGRAELGVLETATAQPPGAMEQMLAPALEDGLLVAEPGTNPSVRFRHDRIREAILRGLDPSRRRFLQLTMARRLAAVPELFAVAAEQYLPVVDAVVDQAERPVVVGLLRRAAGQASLTGDYSLAEALLAAAIRLIDPGETALLAEVHTGHHAALYGLGRLAEADEEYRTIERLCPRALDRADATAVQARSLTHRTRFADAIALGVGSLRELGAAVPPADQLRGEVDRQLQDVYRWLDHAETTAELRRAEISDPALLAEGRLLSAMVPAAYFSGDVITFAWLTLEALRIWIDDGPGRTLVGPASYVATAMAALRGDYARAYQAARRILALAEAHGYEPATSEARMAFCIYACWCEPVETDVRESRRAREGLIAGGNLSFAGYTYYQSVTDLLDCAPSLDLHLAEAEAALAFLRRTGDEQTIAMLEGYRWLADVLRGENAAATAEAATVDRYAGNPPALFNAHFTRAVAAAILGDPGALARHTAAAMPLLPTALGLYVTAVARALRALALAAQARDSDGAERAGLLAELDDVTGWLAARAADAPDNFLHLLRLAEAERAWVAGDFRAAGLAFDAAQREAAQRQRPWHQALIAEHAARFYLAHGFDHAGHDLLAQARQHYLAWGATAKVSQLDWAYPALRPAPGAVVGDAGGQTADLAGRRSTVTAGTMELLGIVSASQALSSETSIARLHTRVAEVLSAMTGATGVQLLLWSEERHGWLRPAADGRTVPVGDASRERTVPMSVLRYAERTREPLVVADAAGDERFTRDPYLAGGGCCSLLAVPVLSRGMLQAVLLLENRLLSGAFTAQRLETVRLIAGQLAVSLDNAKLYADFRQIADEQAALRRVAVLVARAAPPEEVFAAVAAEAGAVLGVDVTILNRYAPDRAEAVAVAVAVWASDGRPPIVVGNRVPLGGRNMTSLMFQSGRPARIDSYTDTSGPVGGIAREAGVQASVGVPVSVAGELWGVMIAASRAEPLPADTEGRLAGFTELAATAVANAEAQAEVSASRARIVAAADQTRRRIERNLHDGAQQRLVSLGLRLRAVQAAIPPQFGGQLDDAVTEAAGALDELGEIARGIHPAVLTERGLAPALKTLARRSAVPVDLQVHVEQRLPEPVEVSAYYVIAEALSNAAKHARASTVSVLTEVAGDVLLLTVRDDGAGGAGFTRGTGLAGLKDRVEALSGRIFLDSPRGAGTSLRVELPLTPSSAASLPLYQCRIPPTTGAVRSANGSWWRQDHRRPSP
jgi:signal transduction histidine kinase